MGWIHMTYFSTAKVNRPTEQLKEPKLGISVSPTVSRNKWTLLKNSSKHLTDAALAPNTSEIKLGYLIEKQQSSLYLILSNQNTGIYQNPAYRHRAPPIYSNGCPKKEAQHAYERRC